VADYVAVTGEGNGATTTGRCLKLATLPRVAGRGDDGEERQDAEPEGTDDAMP
jgi:hypothetical protein